jgi:thiol-disulfide isomerase/thioredoxin
MRRNIYLILTVLLSIGSIIPVSAQGILFEQSSWNEIRIKAKHENKLIFIDFYTDWCGPCKLMSSNIFPLQEVGNFYNQHFVAVKMNAEKEGKALAQQYNVKAYPTMVFINPDGELVSQIVGSVDAKELILRAQNALTPSTDFVTLKDKLDNNDLSDKNDLYRLMLLSKERGDNVEAKKAYEKYFSLYSAVDKETYDLIQKNTKSSKDLSFIYLMKYRVEFSNLIGKDKVDAFMKNKLVFELMSSKYLTIKEYQAERKKIQAQESLSEKELLDMDVNHYWETKDEDHYMIACKALYDKYIHDDEQAIGNILGAISRKIITKPENLRLAEKWAQHAFEIKDNATNSIQLAMVYKELNDKTNALKYANLALAAAERDKVEYLEQLKVVKKEIEESFN